MRWMWIDTITEFEAGRRLVAIKNISLAEEHLHDHFAEDATGPEQPVMPASLIIEGFAQTAGILVGSTSNFAEKVILAKVAQFTLDADAFPGQTLRYEAEIERVDPAGAAATGVISRLDHRTGSNWEPIGTARLLFSHLDQSTSTVDFPEENFVFSENFRTILGSTGLLDDPAKT
jgi:3-hydroxyacyl-[acyl-carrier-protein] dehydratase